MSKNLILGFLHNFFPSRSGGRLRFLVNFPGERGQHPSYDFLFFFIFASLGYIVNLSFGCISFLFMVASAFEFDFSRTDTAHSGFKGNMAVLMHWDPFCDYLCTIGLVSFSPLLLVFDLVFQDLTLLIIVSTGTLALLFLIF